MIIKCLRYATVLSLLFALMAHGQAYAWDWFKKDPPPPPPTWQDKVKSWFKEDPPPPPPTWQDKVKGWFKDDPPPPPTWQDKVKDGWDKTCNWCSEHKTEIAVGAAVVAAATIAYIASDSGGTESKSNYRYEGNAQQGPYREFTKGQRDAFIRQNMERNGGVLRDDITGLRLSLPQQCRPGVTPDPMEAQVDHIYPRSKGGWNTAENAQIISRESNIKKSDHVESKSEFWNNFWND